MPSHRVLVVGNGPVGQTVALLLARWDLDVLLVDRRPGRDAVGSKAICQQRDVLDVWDAVGAGARIAEEGVTWTTARTFHRDRELFSYDVADPGDARFPPFVNISQCRTEELLDERIAAEPRIEVRWDCAVTDLRQDDDGVTASYGGRSSGAVQAPYAVVCGGAHGDPLRDCLGVRFDGCAFDDRFLICDIRTELPGWATERRFYFDPAWNPGRQVLIHPCPDSTFRIDWQVPADFDLESERASGGLERRIRAIIGERPYEIVWSSVYRFSSRVASRMQVGRVLLAGDCAHLFAPFGARGLNSGVGDADNAAWKIAFVLHGWAPVSLVDSYHDERHGAALENLAVTTATMDFLVPQTDAARTRRRDVLGRAATDPEAREQVDSGRLAEPFWYVDSPLVTPDETRPVAGRPARGQPQRPGPGVIVADVPLSGPLARDRGWTTSRTMLRGGFSLFAPEEAVAALDRALREAAGDLPLQVLGWAAVDGDGSLRRVLGVRPGEAWLVRPDAYVAAVLPGSGPGAAAAALARALGAPQDVRGGGQQPSREEQQHHDQQQGVHGVGEHR